MIKNTKRNYHLVGPAYPEHGWVPAPRYLMRRARILNCIGRLVPNELLEIGCGAGMLLHELHAMGFRCTALESSEAARQLAKRLFEDAGLAIPVYAEPQSDWDARFGVICAFEVLEHIKNDAETLVTWSRWLKPGGVLLLSVPAGVARWNAGDEWAGHFRRYERDGLITLLRRSGFEIDRFECYGFPLANLTERINARVCARRIHRETGDTEEDRRRNNDRSGIDRSLNMKIFPLLNSYPGRAALGAFLWIQNRFLSYDLGNGYFVSAFRK